MERPGRWLLGLSVLFLAMTAAPPAHAQVPGELKGKVVEMGTGRPLIGADIYIPEVDRWTVTNDAGDFRITGLPDGVQRVRVGQLGYREFNAEVTVGTGTAIRVELWPDPVILEGLTAQVDRLRARRNALGYTTRVSDRARLSMAHSVEDAVRGMGESLTYCGLGDYCLRRRGQLIRPAVYIDERPAFGFDELRSYDPAELHMIEVIGHQMIRAYTVTFMDRLARGKVALFPVLMF